MSGTLVGVYQSLPGWARSVAAAARGSYLSYWRYDWRTERLAREALDREAWDPDRWKQWQQERLAHTLFRAATKVPFYREYWAKRSPQRASKPWEHLENWPILEKEEVRRNPRAFVADDSSTRWMFSEHTSGTSGTPLTLWRRRETQRRWYALLEARMRSWHGVSRHDRWAILGGQLVVPVSQITPPFWVWNPALHQLYLSSFHLSPEFAPHYLDALKLYRVKYLLGYTSALEFLAREVIRLGRSNLKMTVVLTNAEPVSSMQRSLISEAFQCPLRDTYGMAEMVAAASECSEANMHLWPEVGRIEVFDAHGPVPDGVPGDLVCTGLMNDDMPLIRYRVGDRAALQAADASPCTCGRLLPCLRALEGRTDDVLHTADGRRIGRLDHIFKGGLPVLEAQLVQETLGRLRVRYVPSREFSQDSARELMHAVREYVGPMEIILEPLHRIPREPNGKFRAVICELAKGNRAVSRPPQAIETGSSSKL
jgi:phenylacetate-CoA ligase